MIGVAGLFRLVPGPPELALVSALSSLLGVVSGAAPMPKKAAVFRKMAIANRSLHAKTEKFQCLEVTV